MREGWQCVGGRGAGTMSGGGRGRHYVGGGGPALSRGVYSRLPPLTQPHPATHPSCPHPPAPPQAASTCVA